MSRSKPRNTELIHQLKRENKELQDELKKIQRQINNEAKKEKAEKKSAPKVEVNKEPQQGNCPTCFVGKIEVVELGARKMLACNLACGYRKVIKNAS